MESKQDTIFDENTPAGKEALAEINFELSESGRWLLKVVGGPNSGAEFSMASGNSYTLGTDPATCDIVFHDTSVSRQHARLTLNPDESLLIEDLQSRNGTLIDGEPLKGKSKLAPQTLVTVGTTSFIIYDREGEMQTIISPLLPSIVKALQQEESRGEKVAVTEDPAVAAARREAELKALKEAELLAIQARQKAEYRKSAFIATILIGGLSLLVGLGILSLFQSKPAVIESKVDVEESIKQALQAFPSIRYSYNKASGRLLLLGHLLRASDKNQLFYNLKGVVKSVDDGDVIIDEYVWQDMNQLLSSNPNWKGVSIQATSPGHFVLMGYLQTRRQAEQLSQYVSENFRYLDLLEKKLVVEEELLGSASAELQAIGVKNLAVQISNGELTISGSLPQGKGGDYDAVLERIKLIPGVRVVKNFVYELPPEQTMINISDKYTVTGYSHLGQLISVVINGKILSKGDFLDGMVITEIRPNAILLEKEGVSYRIDYSRA